MSYASQFNKIEDEIERIFQEQKKQYEININQNKEKAKDDKKEVEERRNKKIKNIEVKRKELNNSINSIKDIKVYRKHELRFKKQGKEIGRSNIDNPQQLQTLLRQAIKDFDVKTIPMVSGALLLVNRNWKKQKAELIYTLYIRLMNYWQNEERKYNSECEIDKKEIDSELMRSNNEAQKKAKEELRQKIDDKLKHFFENIEK